MKKDIKDYLHLYFGGFVSVRNLDGRHNTIIDHDFYNSYFDEESGEFLNDPKIILRHLSDMTEGESEFICEAAELGKPTIYVNAELTAYFLSRGFDLFGLIEAGLAIDKTKL